LHTETCKINWEKTSQEVFNLVRGLSPYPGAFTYLDDKVLKVYRAGFEQGNPTVSIGHFETDSKTFLRFATADGWLYVKELQLEGKKRMVVEDFLRGYRF
jgi:methionyl-tRNA formyltransferase